MSHPTPEEYAQLQAQIAELREEQAEIRSQLDRLAGQMSRVLDAALAAGAIGSRREEGRARLWRVPVAVVGTTAAGVQAARRFVAAHPAPVAVVAAGIVGAVVVGAITKPWAGGGEGVPPAAGLPPVSATPTPSSTPGPESPSPTPSPSQTPRSGSGPEMPSIPVAGGGENMPADIPATDEPPRRDVEPEPPTDGADESPPAEEPDGGAEDERDCLLRVQLGDVDLLALLCG